MNITRLKKVFPTGLALFAMIFGSGNLVFPLLTGQKSMGAYPYGLLGFMLSSVIISFIGHIGIMHCKGDVKEFFKEIPKFVYWFMAIVIFFILGPLYVIPRCSLVAFGGVKEIYPNIQIAYFSLFYCILAFILAIKEEKVIPIIGKYLTPLKLGGILFVIFGALYMLPNDTLPLVNCTYAIKEGIKDGYQPMDLLGTLFFSSMIYRFLSNQLKKEKNNDPIELHKRSMLVGVVGFSCIGIIYVLLLFLGAKYSAYTAGLDKTMILPRITNISLGRAAAIMIAFTLFFSTLATAVTLFNVFAEFLSKELFKGIISRYIGLVFALVVSYIVSLVGFETIINFAGDYIFSWLYPCIIAFVIFKFIKIQFMKA